MFNEAKVLIYRTCVESRASGTKEFTDEDNIVDIKELHENIKKGNYVIIENQPKGSDTTKFQRFIMAGEIATEEGMENTYAFIYYGRLLDKNIIRKIIMSFKTSDGDNLLRATYFSN